jgi:Tol biopolymer transport system component
MAADGSDRRRLTSGRWDHEHVWSPDGRRIAYVSDRIVCCSPGASRRYAVFVTSADGGPARQLSDPDSLGDGSPTWSPDGRRVAYTSHRLVCCGTTHRWVVLVVNADGSDRLELPLGREAIWISFSPDWRRVAYADRRSGIWVANVDGTGELQLAHDVHFMPAWSPDGRRIAYSGAGPEQDLIYVVRPDGSGKRLLTRNGFIESRLAWSPDGRRLLYDTDHGAIFALDVVGGSGDQRLTPDTSHRHHSHGFGWSPDGRKVVYASERTGHGDIYVMNADGSGKRRLTRTPRTESNPVWSPALR